MPTKIKPVSTALYFLPVETRIPYQFGHETLTEVICARARMHVADEAGRISEGWGETPLNVQWAWPGTASYAERCDAMQRFCIMLAEAWCEVEEAGHALDVGHHFLEVRLPKLHAAFNAESGVEPMPRLAALVCCSAFDLALHDAFGRLLGVSVFKTFSPEFMQHDLAHYLEPSLTFEGKFPSDFIETQKKRLIACHSVGSKDLLVDADRTGAEPDDGYPVALTEWIEEDGLSFLKVKLRGNDAEWDLKRVVDVGRIAIDKNVTWLTFDFNCTVTDPEYVNRILDQLMYAEPRIYQMLLYVEQPFPYELEENRIDVHSVSARKPLFMDESAHDWKMVRLGRELGWTGVALKTCKTLTGAILSLCWAKAHGMTLMVQDLTNPMLAQIPHCLLAANAGTIMGLETNAMQFYPEASNAERIVHPGLYKRRNGQIDLSTLQGPGFGYREGEIERELPEAAAVFQALEGIES